MHFVALYAISVLVASTIAAPQPKVPKKSTTGTSGRYIVSLKPDVNRDAVKSQTGVISTAAHDWDIINAFVIDGGNKTALDAVLNDPRVDVVEEDGIAQAGAQIRDHRAPWGLARIESNTKITGSVSAQNYTFSWDDGFGGAGVDVYVVDTGIRTTNTFFRGEQHLVPISADGNGHGTHVAGTVGATKYGVAQKVSLIAVKVLADDNFGAWSDIISGINWAVGQKQASGRPSIIQMSIYGGVNDAVDNAVTAAINAGVHVVLCAGNNNADAKDFSPARNSLAVTVGASTIDDTRASFSNFGNLVDIYAPGQDVISTWSTSDEATNSISGTSMATPHVSGIIAYIISKSGNMSPTNMAQTIRNLGLKNILAGNPVPNNLAHNTFI
ncbi:serine protease [Flagelloscypha sp. PMI_526]|nr:serine protease [Flagelloscypha sp. PMI_526]